MGEPPMPQISVRLRSLGVYTYSLLRTLPSNPQPVRDEPRITRPQPVQRPLDVFFERVEHGAERAVVGVLAEVFLGRQQQRGQGVADGPAVAPLVAALAVAGEDAGENTVGLV